jgi:signal transduction histidine kinase
MGSKDKSSRIFVLLSLICTVWVASQGFLISTTNPIFADILIRSQYIMGIIMACGFYIFSIVYPYEKKIDVKLVLISIIISTIFIYLYLFSDLLNTGVKEIGGHGRWSWQFGILHPLFDIIFCTIWIFALKRLYISYTKAIGITKINLRHMFWGLTLGIIPPSLANIILPTLGVYKFNWTGPIFSAIWVFIIGYSIMRYRQMNVRVVITEMLAISLTIIFFINIFIKAQLGVIENVLTFLVFLLLAIFLIRGVLVEVKQKEKLRDLNDNLESKVAEQTLEIRKAFELEKHARRELEKLNEAKNQFIMITQHSLRSPLNQIQTKFKELQSTKDYGKLNQEFQIISKNIDRLTNITNDFLDIVSINKSSNILNLSKISLLPILEKVLEELVYDIKSKNIIVEYNKSPEKWLELNIDESKIFEALLIIIENSIKYNVTNGSIKINHHASDKDFTVSIKDTGTGISKEDADKILNKLFYRGNIAKQTNPNGMGIGLSVAKAILQAHHGTIKINSGDVNKGTEVTITIPINYLI